MALKRNHARPALILPGLEIRLHQRRVLNLRKKIEPDKRKPTYTVNTIECKGEKSYGKIDVHDDD